MSYSWYLCCEAFSSHLPGERKWNADGSTFEIRDKGNGGMYLSVKGVTTKRLQVANLDNSLPVYIKYMAMCNACGNSSPLILIAAIEEMHEDASNIFEITGLSISISMSEIGYVVFCKSRAGNIALWSWYYKYIVIPTIQKGNILFTHLKVINTISYYIYINDMNKIEH